MPRPVPLLFCCALALGCRGATPEPPAAPPAPAVRLAEQVLERMGGRDAWERTRHLHWRFFGGREHLWDKHTGDVRIEADGVTWLMNVDTRAGRVFQAGVEVVDPAERAALLERGHALWVNDSYWVVMPYKLLDPGVRLALAGADTLPDGRVTDVLDVSFESVGLTPENRYLVEVARDTGLVEEWTFFPDTSSEPGFTLPWSGWQRCGEILLATDHGRPWDWDLSVHDELPRELYTEP